MATTESTLATTTTTTTTTLSFLITGASRGFGRAVAVSACRFFVALEANKDDDHHDDQHSDTNITHLRFVLTARSMDDLRQTERNILDEVIAASTGKSSSISTKMTIDVKCHSMDLSDLDSLDDNMDVLLDDLFMRTADHEASPSPSTSNDHHQHDLRRHCRHRFFLINNHGSLGHLGLVVDSPSLNDMRRSVDFNVTSCLWMTARFTRYYCDRISHSTGDNNSNDNRGRDCSGQQSSRLLTDLCDATIVNISSLIAVADEFPTMGIYGAGKAARDKYHTILAKEIEKNSASKSKSTALPSSAATSKTEETPAQQQQNATTATTDSSIKILNYAPGPLETSMTDCMRSSTGMDKGLQRFFQNNTLLDPDDSALKLIRLLHRNDYDNGSHIDYYDLPDAVGDDNR